MPDLRPSRRNVLTLPFALAGSGLVFPHACAAASSTMLTPEDFGAIGYATRAQAAQGHDATKALQRMAIQAARRGVACGGTRGRWYVAGTIDWPSGSHVVGLKLLTGPGATDATPFTIASISAPKRDLAFIDCMVDGNRRNQDLLQTSGGDGRRFGWLLSGYRPGAVKGVTLTRCRAWNCATDGFATWCNGVEQAPGTGYFFGDIQLVDCDFRWNGRHGGSLMGVDGFRMQGGYLKNNGKDLVVSRASPASNGARARALAEVGGTRRYGRPWDCESSLPGEGFRNITFANVDMRGNVGGLLFHHYFYRDGRIASNLRVEHCLLSDPEGQTTGDGSLLFYAVDAQTGRPFQDRTVAFDGIEGIDNQYDRHGIAVYSADHVVIVGGRAIMTGPGYWGHYATISQGGGNLRIDVPSNRHRIWRVEGDRQGLVDGRLSSGKIEANSAS